MAGRQNNTESNTLAEEKGIGEALYRERNKGIKEGMPAFCAEFCPSVSFPVERFWIGEFPGSVKYSKIKEYLNTLK